MRPDHRLTRAAQQLDIAARIKPGIDQNIAHELSICDTRTTNETGITARNTINDPVINAVVKRGNIIDRANAIERLVAAVESAVNELGTALSAQQRRGRRDTPSDKQICYFTGCGDIVESYTTKDGDTRYRSSGLCARHRKQTEREQRSEEISQISS